MDTINWMARKKGEDNICRMVTSISSLMRASISNKRSMVYIREEIKYVQDYLYIQETRYGDKFTSYIEVDERLNELEIPKMTIQTLVENAVVHGVENATWDCFLYVSGEITDGMAVFTVKDDGVGMSQEQLEKLMGTEEEPLVNSWVAQEKQFGRKFLDYWLFGRPLVSKAYRMAADWVNG